MTNHIKKLIADNRWQDILDDRLADVCKVLVEALEELRSNYDTEEPGICYTIPDEALQQAEQIAKGEDVW